MENYQEVLITIQPAAFVSFTQPEKVQYTAKLTQRVAGALVEFGEQNCPYSKATRGNVATEFHLV